METHEDSRHKVDDNILAKLWKLQPTYHDKNLFALSKFQVLHKILFYIKLTYCIFIFTVS
jgi:muconolactone delta-isomerase